MVPSATLKTSLCFVAVAVVCLIFADISVSTFDPWIEMKRVLWGIITPDFLAFETLWLALIRTVAFAVLGVGLAAVIGFPLALVFHIGPVRWGCAFIRAIHELFWALIILQMLGPAPITGILAIAIPFSGIFAKVYAEILEEADAKAVTALPGGSGIVSTFFFARLPDAWVHIKNYTFYRFECGLRSSAVLGFVGLPTLGFYLDSAFKQGHYSQVAALLWLFYGLVASLRLWVRPRLVVPYILVAPFFVGGGVHVSMDNVVRFFTEDIVPAPLRDSSFLQAESWVGLSDWLWNLLAYQAVPGIVATVVLTQIALVATGMLTLGFFPLVSAQFFGRPGRAIGHTFLVIVRSTPELILAYVFLQFWGPSMLPAIIALALHNAAIIGDLIGRHSNEITLRPDSSSGFNRYSYEVLPRVYGQFLAFLFYRWEVIMRETAILGILGIATLGFFVDSAIAEIRLDRAMFLILLTALLNIGIDALSRSIRARLRLSSTPDYE